MKRDLLMRDRTVRTWMGHNAKAAVVLALVLAVSACSGGADGGSEAAGSDGDGAETTLSAEGSAGESGEGESGGSAGDEAESTETPEPPAPTIPDVEPILTGAPQIVTLTPVVAERLRPVLSWEPVDGAASYSVVVLDEAGDPYWMWLGAESAVPLGGSETSDFGVGPIIGVDYSWSVVAFGADNELLGASGQLPISLE